MAHSPDGRLALIVGGSGSIGAETGRLYADAGPARRRALRAPGGRGGNKGPAADYRT